MKNLPVENRMRLVSDNGSSYLSHAFEDYLRVLPIRHIRCTPHHPQTNGKIERFLETLKARLNLLVNITDSRQCPCAKSEIRCIFKLSNRCLSKSTNRIYLALIMVTKLQS